MRAPVAKSGVHSVRARSSPSDPPGQIDRDPTNATDAAEPCAPSVPDESRRAWAVSQVGLGADAAVFGGEEGGPFDAGTVQAVGACFEDGFRGGEGAGGSVGELPSPADGGGVDVVGGDDLVHQTEGARFVGLDEAAGVD